MTQHDYTVSTGNVFADLGMPTPEERLVKAELAQKIGEILRKRKLTQVQAAVVLGVDQPKVSALVCGRLSRFSIEKLMQFLLLLGKDVAITIKPRQRLRSKTRARAPRRTGSVSNRGTMTVVDSVTARTSEL